MTSLKAGQARSESGFTLIDMLFVIAIIGLLSTLAIPGLMRARGAAQSASALGTVRVVNSAQLSFAITCGFGFYAPDLQTLGKKPPLAAEAFLAPELSAGPTFIKSGYSFSMGGHGRPRRTRVVQRPRGGRDGGRLRVRGRSSGYHATGALLRNECRRHDIRGRWRATWRPCLKSGAPPGGAPIK